MVLCKVREKAREITFDYLFNSDFCTSITTFKFAEFTEIKMPNTVGKDIFSVHMTLYMMPLKILYFRPT